MPFNVLCQFTKGAGRRTLADFVTVSERRQAFHDARGAREYRRVVARQLGPGERKEVPSGRRAGPPAG